MGTDAKVRRGRPKAMPDDERRKQIVQAAEKLFIRKGFADTRTHEIAALCRISKQTLYRLFPGKLDLFAAVVDAHRLKMVDFGDGYDDIPLDEALARMFMIDLDEEAYELRGAFLRTINIEAVQHPKIHELLRRQGGRQIRAELAKWLDRQCRKGRLEIKDTGSAAHMLLDMLVGAVFLDAQGGFGWAGREERAAHFWQCIDIFLKGVLPGGDRS
ncbi:TetR/AcrR family transcriptional regulator [Pseudodesulfovibrio thermohalotolerans]|uniref:TetR/AcrR family transcriptional regulator n=1 Tax=Pseudodesulfovibrio thermohalotolerans TaxID=2880651 RepID=UPI0022B9F4EB|nr:TetR/AcrR family transcriptional regulator [Pseudodesulfovibrio thermohalotolerans]WFS63126.1 TetR/AcrR family transcriptional regulator [Pseudodesulfovibrio thermohalotolerans]